MNNITDIPRFEEREFRQASAFRVKAGTNGLQGGDAGHGGVTYLELSEDGADVQVAVDGTTVKITLGGDSELETFIKALEFAVATLRAQAGIGDSEEVPSPVASEIEHLRADLRELSDARWDQHNSKPGAARLRECAARVVLSAKRVESRVKENTFPTA